jgi:hypothetical protein
MFQTEAYLYDRKLRSQTFIVQAPGLLHSILPSFDWQAFVEVEVCPTLSGHLTLRLSLHLPMTFHVVHNKDSLKNFDRIM